MKKPVGYTNFHVSIEPQAKDDFKEKLIKENLGEMRGFVYYFIDQYVKDLVPPEVLDDINRYQAENPGKTEGCYIHLLLREQDHQELALRKIRLKILPQHFCRYFIDRFLANQLPPETIQEIRNYKIPD